MNYLIGINEIIFMTVKDILELKFYIVNTGFKLVLSNEMGLFRSI